MSSGQRGDSLLRWVSLMVPGMFAALAWKATEGLPLLNRVVSGVALGLMIYAIFYFAVKGFKRRDDS